MSCCPDLFDPAFYQREFNACEDVIGKLHFLFRDLCNLRAAVGMFENITNSKITTIQTSVAANSSNISLLQTNLSEVQKKISDLIANFDALSKNNAEFLASVETIIAEFRSTITALTGRVNTLSADLSSQSQRITNLENVVDTDLLNSVIATYEQVMTRLESLVTSTISTYVDPKFEDVTGEIADVNAKINAETGRATQAEASLSSRIDTNANAISALSTSISTQISGIRAEFQELTVGVNELICQLAKRIAAEEKRANGAENCLKWAIENEVKNRCEQVKCLDDRITAEENQRKADDEKLNISIVATDVNVDALTERVKVNEADITEIRKDFEGLNEDFILVRSEVDEFNDRLQNAETQIADNTRQIAEERELREEQISAIEEEIAEAIGNKFSFENKAELVDASVTYKDVTISFIVNGTGYDINVALSGDRLFYLRSNVAFVNVGTATGEITASDYWNFGRGTLGLGGSLPIASDNQRFYFANIDLAGYIGDHFNLVISSVKHDTDDTWRTDIIFRSVGV